MKHYSKRARRRAKQAKQQDTTPIEQTRAERPNEYARQHHHIVEPTGPGKSYRPAVNLTQDLIGVLFMRDRITSTEEQAARHFQNIRTAYLAELEIKTYRSCLDTEGGGFDGSDGNPATIAANDDLRDLLGPRHYAFVARECDKRPNQRCDDLRRLRICLRKIAGA